MDFIRHFAPDRAMRNALSYNAPRVRKPFGSLFIQIIRTMKLTSVLLLAFCLQASARNNALQRIDITVKGGSLQRLFTEIEKQTDYTFFYDVTMLRGMKPVTLVVKNATVEDILGLVLAGRDLDYAITDKTIFVKKLRQREDGKIQQEASYLPDAPTGGASTGANFHLEVSVSMSDSMICLLILLSNIITSIVALTCRRVEAIPSRKEAFRRFVLKVVMCLIHFGTFALECFELWRWLSGK